MNIKLDELVKSQKCPRIVIPVKTGIQRFQRVTKTLDTGFHRCDDFLREHQASLAGRAKLFNCRQKQSDNSELSYVEIRQSF
jgi:hypothetical protein